MEFENHQNDDLVLLLTQLSYVTKHVMKGNYVKLENVMERLESISWSLRNYVT